jgi:hypothetical protein
MLGENFVKLVQSVLFDFKPAHDIIFRLGERSLEAIHIAKDGGFTISAQVPITPSVPIGSNEIFFSISRAQAVRATYAFTRWHLLACRYERDKSVLWVEDEQCKVPLRASQISDFEQPPESIVLGQLEAKLLSAACSTACLFYKRKVNRLSAKNDLTIKDGFAAHGYLYAAARYPIARSPHFTVPGEHIPNFLRLAARCRGTITLRESANEFFLSDQYQLAGRWRKTGAAANNVPRLCEPAIAEVTLSLTTMQVPLSLLAVFTENVRLTSVHEDNQSLLLLTGDFKGRPMTGRVPFSSNGASNFDCTVKTQDLALACFQFSRENFTLKVTERFVLVKGSGHEAIMEMFLSRFEPA